MTTLGTLDELGIRRVTDKSSLDHDCLVKNERLFAPFRDVPITLLEIGVFDGGSLRLWEDYFPRATIVGIDIQDACRRHEGGRRIVEIASQADGTAMAAIGQKYGPSIIIDDGSHQADHILTSFQALYPSLREGGVYIVEDLAMHSGSEAAAHRGCAVISPQAYFLRLANRVSCPDEDVDIDPRIFASTESVEFIYCLAVVRKKTGREPEGIANRRAIVEKLESHHPWGWFSGYIINNGGSKDEAVECARRAIAMAPLELVHYLELSRALEQTERLEEALDAAKEAQRRVPNHRGVADRLSRLALRLEAQRRVSHSG